MTKTIRHLLDILAEVPDRNNRGKRHPLSAILGSEIGVMLPLPSGEI